MEHIIVSENDYFKILTAEEGYYITDYNTDEPVEKFSSLLIAYLPKDADYSKYYAISVEQNKTYEEEKMKALGIEPMNR